jgi:predicted MFS family arabinose efflux permease
MLRPLTVAVVLFAAATAYFTYATDAARRGGLGEMAGPEVFVLVGATGLAGLGAGAMAMKVGARVVATGALVVLGASVLVLGLGAGSLAAVLTSAGLFGVGNTVGSAALPIWTAELVPGHPAAAFAAALVVGSLSSIATPAVVGALTPRYGLTAVLVAVAFATAATGLALAVTRRRPERRAPAG